MIRGNKKTKQIFRSERTMSLDKGSHLHGLGNSLSKFLLLQESKILVNIASSILYASLSFKYNIVAPALVLCGFFPHLHNFIIGYQ